jgi:SAM-dependent methyltransferase
MSDTATETRPNRWDTNASFWVQIIREHRDKYRNDLTDPAMLEAIGQPDGLAVLDAGCGEGYLSRILARNGAIVTGVDSATKLIEAARAQNLADELPVSFDISNVDELPYADDTWFRPLEFYTEELRKSGFVITSLTEPHPSPEQVQADDWWRKGFTRPLFMLLVAQKFSS